MEHRLYCYNVKSGEPCGPEILNRQGSNTNVTRAFKSAASTPHCDVVRSRHHSNGLLQGVSTLLFLVLRPTLTN
jgi:hypothetical protein